jgi:catechol 2,3-dioxygenase-like lactoylglutathione lyase family enzyme
MLGAKNVAAMIAVRDLDVARRFYEDTIGLSAVQESPETVVYKSGDGFVVVYPSQYAGTNKATAAAWSAGSDFDAVIDDLRGKGVAFEHYDELPGVTREGDVHKFDDGKAAWFRDPDGNILSIVDQAM